MKASICILNVLSDCIVLIVKSALCGVGTGPPHLVRHGQSVIGLFIPVAYFIPRQSPRAHMKASVCIFNVLSDYTALL